ncbi:MAG: 50S ribosomal protein L21 [Christensenella sp.]|nr:50S ribosomal protein L21 [Christensenella sp.]
MYAIIQSGGKQYKVEKGTVVKVEKLDAEVGSEVTFEALLTASGKTIKVGKPVVKGVTVTGKVLAQDKEKKVIVFKYKPKKDFRKKQGHRQPYTKVEILSIGAAEKEADEQAAE